MLTTVVRPNPTTPGDYHEALVHHIGHDLAVRSNMQPIQIVVVQCVASDGRVSLTTRPDEAPVDEARWRPHLSAPLFFAGRSVGCRTCQMPVARWRPHLSAPLFFAGRSVGCRTCQMPVAR